MNLANLRSNRVKQTLQDGGFVLGTWIMMNRSPSIVRLCAVSGLDFVFIDTEHSDFSWETVGSLCEMARACDVVPIVRAYDTAPGLANRIQDLGAMGLMYHDVTARADIDDILAAMSYPPRGLRGSTSASATMDYSIGDGKAIRAHVDENSMLVAQIESIKGVENLPDILTGGGVDLVEVGRGDLSASLGVPLEARHPDVLAALDDVIAICADHAVAVGVNAQGIDDGIDLIDRGVRSIAFSNDRRIVLNAYRDAAETLNSHAASTFGRTSSTEDSAVDVQAAPSQVTSHG